MPQTQSKPQFLLCVDNAGYLASLEVRKVYRALPDPTAESRGFTRVIDESGEDYLYPLDRFVAVNVPEAAVALFSGST
jgi:hypothetical protein